MRKSTRRAIGRYWGYLLLVLLYFGWFVFHVGAVGLAAISVLSVVYFLVQAPVPCCAQNRDGTTFCRNNARGLLGGCWLKSHQWNNLKLLLKRQSWSTFARGFFRGVSGNAAAVSALAGSTSACAAVVTLMLKA